jgi:hypothetical protein
MDQNLLSTMMERTKIIKAEKCIWGQVIGKLNIHRTRET